MLIRISILFILTINISGNAVAFEDKKTHPYITDSAAELSNIDYYVMNTLGFVDGKTLVVYGKEVKEWFKQGSTDEDHPKCRAVNHFHNPLKAWSQSGASDLPPQNWVCGSSSWPTYSNVTWATGYVAPAPGGAKETNFSKNEDRKPINWDEARDLYYKALTDSHVVLREKYLAQSFHAVGQVMHLLEDMAVPAHTRNDFWSHLFPQWGGSTQISDWVYQPFERYVLRNTDTLVADAAKTANDNSPVFGTSSVTNFWDTDLYNGLNPSMAKNIGLAEFSNANYMSDFTIPNNVLTVGGHFFDYPLINGSTHKICEGINASGKKQKYVSRKTPPSSIPATDCDHFAVVTLRSSLFRSTTYLNNHIDSISLDLDDKVHETYARELVPRAIGYAKELVNYFFRGTLAVSPPDEHVYAITDGSKTASVTSTYWDGDDYQEVATEQQQFTKIKAKIKNTTPNENAGDGTLTAVAEYSIIPNYHPDLSSYPPSDENLASLNTTMEQVPYSYSVSVPITISSANPLSSTEAREFVFSFPDQPIPAGVTDLSFYFVFKGTLGNEKDNAIAVAWKDMSEPVHQTFWNLTDRFSLDYILRTSEEIQNSNEVTQEKRYLVDLDKNGIYNERPNSDGKNEPYIDPYPMSFEISYAGTDPATSTVFPSASVDILAPGKHIRLVVLVESPTEDSPTNYVGLQANDEIFGERHFSAPFRTYRGQVSTHDT